MNETNGIQLAPRNARECRGGEVHSLATEESPCPSGEVAERAIKWGSFADLLASVVPERSRASFRQVFNGRFGILFAICRRDQLGRAEILEPQLKEPASTPGLGGDSIRIPSANRMRGVELSALRKSHVKYGCDPSPFFDQ